MKTADIRSRFLDYFRSKGHAVLPSSSLVPADDPTLLFTNAGMVQFKRVFLGEKDIGVSRAATSQKCVRAGGKHNDLEEVGRTARHLTFFEMLGNFSFGDYFKKDAITFAWELMTEVYGLEGGRFFATVHHTDDEAEELWLKHVGLPADRVFRLGDKDNFWQMGETGPCGPCSEIHFDLRSGAELGTDLTVDEFVALGERGDILELWNLVFMQYDRAADGTLTPLPAPSIDTGAGLERLASVLQGVDSNYKTDLFMPLIERAAAVVGEAYPGDSPRGVSYRVLADHARSVAFLLADGVFPSNEGRGYVLRRILRRAVRHAWLLGRREPTLVHVVDEVVNVMGDAYPELAQRRDHLLRATREEEERFLATIDSGMSRFDELAPALPETEWSAVEKGSRSFPVVAGDDVFRLYDTFGFPLDLTELIAQERGYRVDTEGFEQALEEQRERSRQDRRATGVEAADGFARGWQELVAEPEQEFVGYLYTTLDTEVIAVRHEAAAGNGDGRPRVALQLARNPFYAEAGGQVSDRGEIRGEGWRVVVEDVRRVAGRVAVIGSMEGELPAQDRPIAATAMVERTSRLDTQRNHTATHLLHAALRGVLGEHVVQRGSLVAPDRLRFDFAHTGPLTADELRVVEERVNDAILANHDVVTEQSSYREAVARGAMALFGEKYGDVVRVVTVPGVSVELCGGTHVPHTSDIGTFRIVSESGVAAGIRRIEAVTGREAYRRSVAHDAILEQAAAMLKTTPDSVLRRIEQVIEEQRDLKRQIERARTAGAVDRVAELLASAENVDGLNVIAASLDVDGADELRALGDQLRERMDHGLAVLAGRTPERVSLIAVVTDDLLAKGVRADAVVREVARATGGSGGGRPHMAQGGVGDADKVPDALARTGDIVRALLAKAGA
jgi:alanyl-tRNA synthetase